MEMSQTPPKVSVAARGGSGYPQIDPPGWEQQQQQQQGVAEDSPASPARQALGMYPHQQKGPGDGIAAGEGSGDRIVAGEDPGPPKDTGFDCCGTCCACCPPVVAQERRRKAFLGAWAAVWSGNQHGCLTGYSLLAIRIVLFLLNIMVLVWSLIESTIIDNYLIYLTNWNVILQCFYFALAMPATFYATKRYQADGGRPSPCPAWIHMTWTTYSTTLVVVFITDILYWALLYDGGPIEAVNVITHAINFVWIFIEFVVAGNQVPLAHMSVAFIYGAAFVAWSVIFWLLGYTNSDGFKYIYSVLDWENDRNTAAGYAFGVIFIAFPLVACCWSCMSEGRLRAYTRQPLEIPGGYGV